MKKTEEGIEGLRTPDVMFVLAANYDSLDFGFNARHPELTKCPGHDTGFSC